MKLTKLRFVMYVINLDLDLKYPLLLLFVSSLLLLYPTEYNPSISSIPLFLDRLVSSASSKPKTSSPVTFASLLVFAGTQRVRFYNTGPSLVPGVIVMSIGDASFDRPELARLDANFSNVVTVFNVCPHEISIDIPALASMGLELHPLQVNSSDALVRQSTYKATKGQFTVPGRTTSVFVEPRC